MAGPYADLKQRLDRATSDSEAIRIVKEDSNASSQSDIRNTIDGTSLDEPTLAETLRAQVALRALAESRIPTPSSETERARAIKQSPFYSDKGIDQKRNWLSDALERLKNIRIDAKPKTTNIGGGGVLGALFVGIVWCLLAAGVVTLVYFAVKHIRWQGTLKRKVKTLLEEDEPDRSLDEWLQLADEHAAAGRYRHAVRALYLACLLKFDEADIARFDRGETNWEHLARIEESENLPSTLDFRTPTRRFDVIWYGNRTDGMPDVDQFRVWYKQIGDSLTKVPA
jgi:hypothetical protein